MFLFRGRESHPRSFLKAVSWRALGSIDTFTLGFLFTSDVKTAGSIAGTEVTLESGVEAPAKVSLHQVGKLPFGGDLTDAARTVYLPIAGHEVVAALEPGALYRIDSDDSAAWVVSSDRPFFATAVV